MLSVHSPAGTPLRDGVWLKVFASSLAPLPKRRGVFFYNAAMRAFYIAVLFSVLVICAACSPPPTVPPAPPIGHGATMSVPTATPTLTPTPQRDRRQPRLGRGRQRWGRGR